MEQRQPAHTAARPGLAVPPHAVVELYPRAAILAAWFNAWRAGAVDGLIDCPVVRPDDPFNGSDVDVPGWQTARLPLGAALSMLPGEAKAAVVLPVPGDPAGLPTPVVPRAADAGQAVLIPLAGGTVAITPTMAAEGRTVWHAGFVPTTVGPVGDIRSERLAIMELLTFAVSVVESATLPSADGRATSRRVAGLATVPMPPGSAGAAVELARSSATLITIVSDALASVATRDRDAKLVGALAPLGRAGRRGLAVAFSNAGGEARS
ncbi:MAG: hypothetical protein KDC23_00635 [Actinobacteria bacterium]|nr:hypothetical protein [Actinomycetota bacterium]